MVAKSTPNVKEVERFWKKVDKSSSCWIWQAAKNRKGFGVAVIGGKQQQAHRIAWALEHGRIPDGQFVRQSCRNPTCVNPEHLFLGHPSAERSAADTPVLPQPQEPAKEGKKPYSDFPLTLHNSGQWCKQIRSRTHYFGREPNEALELYLNQRDDLQAGRTPREQISDGLTVVDLCNHFLTQFEVLVENGERSRITFQAYFRTAERIIEYLGRDLYVQQLRSDDFARMRQIYADRNVSPTALGDFVRLTKVIFNYAYDEDGDGLLDSPVRFGKAFREPDKKAKRRQKQKKQREHGLREFEPDELAVILTEAGKQLKAMVLLAVNAGFYQSDIAALPQSALAVKRGWVVFPRQKTAVPRCCPLWPETVKALQTVMDNRVKPSDPVYNDLVFLTERGGPVVVISERSRCDTVAARFNRLLERLDIKRHGVGFGSLRHTFRTAADAHPDEPAINMIMGHEDDSDMGQTYVQKRDDKRLREVTDHVHSVLFPRQK